MSNRRVQSQLFLASVSRPHIYSKSTLEEPIISLYFDGGCSPNPGRKYGSFEVIFQSRSVLLKRRVDLGEGTNNEAEFDALWLALTELLRFLEENGLSPMGYSLEIFTDSTIVRNRMMGKNVIYKKWQASSERMFKFAEKCLRLTGLFKGHRVVWRGRDQNVNRFGH